MGDLIQRLPTDEICLSEEEKHTFTLLFGKDTNKEKENNDVQVINEIPSIRELRKEIIHLCIFVIVIFIINTPIFIQIVKTYIPLCQNSWVATCLVQAVIASGFIWFIINLSYSKK